LRAAMEHAQDDMELRLLTEARVEAERAMKAVESALKADCSLLDDGERDAIGRQIDVVMAAVRGNDRDLINAEVENLDSVTRPFAEKRMDKGIRSALKGVEVEKLDT